MAKKKSKSSRSMKEALEESNGMCECGSADCASCGGESCACGGAGCGGCYGGHGSGYWGYLKYAKLVVGLLLLASAVSPLAISTQAAVGVLGLWIIFKTALKLYYKY